MDRIEILTIGDELVEGRLVDTNAGCLSDLLSTAGFTVARHTSVGDDPQEIASVLWESASRSSAVLISGGLGPTCDDLTAAAAAKAFERPITRSEQALEHARQFFERRGLSMSSTNEKQADLPAGCTILPNPRGTAVGFGLQVSQCRLYFMPGVPRELRGMFRDSVLPDLRRHLESRPPEIGTLRVFGTGESNVAEALQGLGDDLPPTTRLTVQYRATFPEIHVRLVVRGDGKEGEDLFRLMDEASRRLGHHVYASSRGPTTLTFSEVVVEELLRAGARIAIADRFTGGLVSHTLASDPRFGEILAGCWVLGDTHPATELQGVSREPGETGSNPAEQLARGVRERFGATHGLAVTGPAGPSDLPSGDRDGTIWLAVASNHDTASRQLCFPIERDRLQRLAAHAALAFLRRAL